MTQQMTDAPDHYPALWRRAWPHLIAMCDGKRHCFFNHELAAALRRDGLIQSVGGGDWTITAAGRKAVDHG